MISSTRLYGIEPELSPAQVDPYLRLAAACINQAAHEAQRDQGAAEWLATSPIAALMLEALGMSPEVVSPIAETWAETPGGVISVCLYQEA